MDTPPIGTGTRTGTGTGRRVTYAPYEEFCEPVPLDGLMSASGDAIARLEPAREVGVAPPVDLAGILEETTDSPGPSYDARAWWTRPLTIRETYVASLREATCVGGRIRKISRGRHNHGQLLLARGGRLVDDSYYLRDRSRSLPEDLLEPHRDGGEVLLEDLDDLPLRTGSYYLVGSAHAHFGHFLLEGLARLWALASLDGDLSFVLYEPDVTSWQLALLASAGVAPERVVHVHEATRFERLVVPARAYNLHNSSSPEQDGLWRRIGDSFESPGTPPRVYLSRSRFSKRRALLNETEVEDIFASRDFAIVHPETLDIGEQVAIARGAEYLAGSAGSAMYLGAFQRRGARKLIISPVGFSFNDDQLISHFRGTSLHYFMAPEFDDPTAPPRYANYSVDGGPLANAIDRWLAIPTRLG